MGLVLQLVETRADGETRSVELMELGRPGDLRDIADLGLTLPEAKQLLARVRLWCTDRARGRSCPNPAWAHPTRTQSGRPNSSMRLSAWTATFTSVARRSSARARSPSPITCLNLPMVASILARMLYPAAVCQPILPVSAMSWMWRSRCVGAVPAVSLGTAVERGGTTTVASG